ncbi:hypothetical protein ACOMHN_015490 [Nucella lapillus]
MKGAPVSSVWCPPSEQSEMKGAPVSSVSVCGSCSCNLTTVNQSPCDNFRLQPVNQSPCDNFRLQPDHSEPVSL